MRKSQRLSLEKIKSDVKDVIWKYFSSLFNNYK